MKKCLLLIYILLLPFINLGQIVQPIPKLVPNKLNNSYKKTLVITSPKPNYVLPTYNKKYNKKYNSSLVSESDSKFESQINTNREKHNIGIGYGFTLCTFQTHQILQDSYAVIAYKHLISLKAEENNSDFIALKTTHSFNLINFSPYKKSTYRWTFELGYQYKRKKVFWLFEKYYMYHLVGFGRYTYNTSNPIYFFNADSILDEISVIHLNFVSYKVGWQLSKNIFIDSYILYNYAENLYSKYAIGINFYYMPSFKFKK